MARSARSIPPNYPQPIGTQLLKADAQRQISIVRQEVVTDLLSVLADLREPQVRQRLVKVIESNLRAGLTAAEKAESLWPELQAVQESLAAKADLKPALAKKHLKLFEQFDRVQRRSLALLAESFDHIRVILDRLQPPDSPPSGSALLAPQKSS